MKMLSQVVGKISILDRGPHKPVFVTLSNHRRYECVLNVWLCLLSLSVEVCSPGFSQTTVIVIAAAGGVGALSITMLVLRVVCKIKKKRYKRFQDESGTAQT